MIFTNCVKCDEPIVVDYEAGGTGAGGARKVDCTKCQTENFVELVSIGGTTLSREDFFEKHPNAIRENK